MEIIIEIIRVVIIISRYIILYEKRDVQCHFNFADLQYTQ